MAPPVVVAVRVHSRRVARPRPARVSLQTPAAAGVADDVLLVEAEAATGEVGLGFAAWPGPAPELGAALLREQFAPMAVGQSPLAVESLFRRAESAWRGVGFAGAAARAYSALDWALWDLAAQVVGLPLAEYLGNANPGGASAFWAADVGPGFDPRALADEAKTYIKLGALGVRVPLGTSDVQADADRVRELHDLLGEDAWVGVDGRSNYDLTTALALAHFLQDQGIDWFENALPAGDTAGFDRLSRVVEMPLATGTEFTAVAEHLRVMQAGFVRVLRPDPARLGGLTPVKQLAAAAALLHVSLAPVGPAEWAVHLGQGLRNVSLIELVPLAQTLVEGGPVLRNGRFVAGPGPGCGLKLRA